jgi:hypothetical protein
MAPFHQIPLVGPGNELQLTIDGGAVPHVDVVAAAHESPLTSPAAGSPAAGTQAVAAGQISLTGSRQQR